jgi:PAS domain S-box-containing protein
LYEPLADDLLGAMTEAVYAVDCDRRIIFWNAAAEQLTAYSAAEVVGRRCQDNLLNHVDETGRQLCGDGCPLLATVQDGRTREALVSLHHRSGHCLPVAVRAAALRSADETIIGAVEVFHDDSRFRAVNDLLDTARREALTDPLTGIANRRMLHRALDLRRDQEQALVLADRARRLVAGSSPVPQRGDVSVTLTVGVAVVRPGEEPKGLVQRASAATLRAKRAGPNSCLGG